MILDVYLADQLVGRLRSTTGFEYELKLLRGDLVISNYFNGPRGTLSFETCSPFFENILPEGERKSLICRSLNIHRNDNLGLLAKIGRETAGALSVVPEGETPNILDAPDLSDLTHSQILAKAKGNIEGVTFKNRMSLAGAQAKTSIVLDEAQLIDFEETKLREVVFQVCENRSLTNFIIKPEVNPVLPQSVNNEYFCMTLAGDVGIHVADVYRCYLHGEAGLVPALLIRRFDRQELEGARAPFHMEDLCQLMGIPPEYKYQEYSAAKLAHVGPGVSDLVLKAKIGRNVTKGLQQIIKLIIFNYIIENQDAHGKNFSFLYGDGQTYEFAPAYDLISTGPYDDLNEELSMHVGGEYDPYQLSSNHFKTMCAEAGFSFAAFKKETQKIIEILEPKIKAVQQSMKKASVERQIAEIMARRCQHLSDIFAFEFEFTWDDTVHSKAFINPKTIQ